MESEEYVCSQPGCKFRFETYYELWRHMRTHSIGIPYSCGFCYEGCTTSGNLGRHLKKHVTQKNVCNEPGPWKVFTGHMICDAGFLDYVCEPCEMAFETRQDLDIHDWIHTGKKPFKCDFCEKCFSVSDKLNSHKKIHIRETNVETQDTENQGTTHSLQRKKDQQTTKSKKMGEHVTRYGAVMKGEEWERAYTCRVLGCG
jgi:uncharacterized Zn-finger protein